VTFGLFTDGVDNFQKAYEEGMIDRVFATNLIYRPPSCWLRPGLSTSTWPSLSPS
jgi:ribose-phosphate pyrophosphokinase